jgi:siderophore ferric iron reductase
VPKLSDISQAIKGIDISGFRLPPAPQERGEVETLIASAGAQLRAMAETMLDEINVLTRLKRRPALRLLADRMLSLMVRLGHYRPGTTIEEQKRYCALWLAAMGLTGEGDLETLDVANGRQVVIMARKGCCLDYLALGGVYCSTCPKQDEAVRRERQGREAAAEMDAAEAEPPR